jgi:dUTP pyrophosphatase
MNVQCKIMDSRLLNCMPAYASMGSAGLDLRMMSDFPKLLHPGRAELVPTGLSIYIGDPGYMALILPRSGMGHKLGVVLGNGVGLIDSDYQGPLMMSLLNRTDEPLVLQPLERVAQLVFVPVVQATLSIVDQFTTNTERGQGGFGSTGR